jgi:hypothetical protein
VQSVYAKAEEAAMQLIQGFPNTAERGAALRDLTSREPLFAPYVSEAISRIEGDAEKQGRASLRGA